MSPLLFDVQSDEDSSFKIVKVPKAESVSLIPTVVLPTTEIIELLFLPLTCRNLPLTEKG